MTTQQRTMEAAYERRNLEGFEGDTIMRDRFERLITDYKIDLVIEGGTYLGGTTRQLAKMVAHIITIEVNAVHYARARTILKDLTNVHQMLGSTVDLLPIVLEGLQRNVLIFLDSHWLDHNPLLEELDIIYKSGLKPVIAIHDFKVPGQLDLGFDTYKDIVYEWSWIKPNVERIYGVDGYIAEYNSKAVGAKRGVVYLMPK